MATIHERLNAATSRMARATTALRIRSEDAARAENNGGSSDDIADRAEAAVRSIERAAARLEKMLT